MIMPVGRKGRFEVHVAWFSGGVSSAVAIKIAIDYLDRIIYIHIDDQHPDTIRFVRECETWFDKPITILQSRYPNVESAVLAAGGRGYINGPRGASCTRLLKKRVRAEWESDHDEILLEYVWGIDVQEANRVERIMASMPDQSHQFPLVENNIQKKEAHQILKASGIERPEMYAMGYHNNNCIGCVKGGMGYWNKIREDFPDVFAKRAALERRVGASCINGIFLDQLEAGRGRHAGPLCDDCGIMCEMLLLR